MSEQVTMTGPARLRELAANARLYGYLWMSRDLDQMAALWEADLERAANDLMLSEESFVTMRAKRDYVLSELRELRAALEQARALAEKWKFSESKDIAWCADELAAALLSAAPGGAA